jgi:hypothetical protein
MVAAALLSPHEGSSTNISSLIAMVWPASTELPKLETTRTSPT